MSRDNTGEAQLVPLGQKLALGVGFFCLFFIEKTSDILAVPFYQMTLGVDPFLFGVALTIPIVFSSFLSPWVGHFSDNLQNRFGRRKPLIFISAWCLALLFGLMWMVPAHWAAEQQLVYFFCVSLLFYFAAQFYSVPLTSLSYEMSRDDHQRIKVMEINSYFIKLASLGTQWLYPLASLALFGSVFFGIKVVGWAVAILVIGLLGMLPALLVKEQPRKLGPQRGTRLSVLASSRSILAVPLMRLIVVLVIMQVGLVAYAAKMDYYVLVYYMFGGDIAEGAVWKAVLSMGFAIAAAVYIPLVSMLSRKLGKLSALQVIFLMNALGGVAKWFIYMPGVTWFLLLDPILCSAIWSSMTVIIPALVAQASDDDARATSVQREGGFAGMHHWVVTMSVIFTILLAGATLNWIGFDAKQGGEQAIDTLLSMKTILVLGTTVPSLVAIAAIARFKKRNTI
ncbi:MFS transporter [Microbulbifer agarilyticus]|uniref:MFS transporter n=1 Tax=Microbulbifer agarilyticus TaxID=260552 RepID=UPI001CD73BFF|nr:MFS transporter [Microbulbifer agarilyticus]MCA0900813.1 MFS transporter [Microbulbifer agarilyticus]